MFSTLKSLFGKSPAQNEQIAVQPAGVVFPWPKGTRLTAMEEVTIAIPYAVLGDDEKIGSVILSDSDDLEIQIPEKKEASSVLFLKFREGMSVSLTKSCQAYVASADKAPKRIKVTQPPK